MLSASYKIKIQLKKDDPKSTRLPELQGSKKIKIQFKR